MESSKQKSQGLICVLEGPPGGKAEGDIGVWRVVRRLGCKPWQEVGSSDPA